MRPFGGLSLPLPCQERPRVLRTSGPSTNHPGLQEAKRLAAQTSLLEATQQTFTLSDARFKAGVDNYLTVLDAQRSLYAAQQTLIGLQLAEQANRITLYKVLGGG